MKRNSSTATIRLKLQMEDPRFNLAMHDRAKTLAELAMLNEKANALFHRVEALEAFQRDGKAKKK